VTVIVAPVRVKGAGAAEEIDSAIREMNAYGKVDVMIVGRGGGSLEDLWAFNEESVARAISDSTIPVISAVGHEVDVTIADFVADLRAPTPSAAAELVVKDRASLLDIIETNWYSIDSNMWDSLRGKAETIRSLLRTYAFSRPLDLYRQHSQRVDELNRSLNRAGAHSLELLGERTRGLSQRVAALDPALALKRGYTIVYRDGRIVGSRALLKPEDTIEIRFHDGTAHSRIED
jgi:exodeoxyribonuclease VII large subunit